MNDTRPFPLHNALPQIDTFTKSKPAPLRHNYAAADHPLVVHGEETLPVYWLPRGEARRRESVTAWGEEDAVTSLVMTSRATGLVQQLKNTAEMCGMFANWSDSANTDL